MRKISALYLSVFIVLYGLPLQAFAANAKDLSLENVVLPSEIKSMGKKVGSIFYSPSVKNRPLIPVHFWGEIKLSGLHFVPVETTLVEGVSLAGGPNNSGILDEVKLSRLENGQRRQMEFDLTTGGSKEAQSLKLRPGDMVYIEKSHFYENRAYYTSLVGVIATILSSIILYDQIKKD